MDSKGRIAELEEMICSKNKQISANQQRILELMQRLQWYMAKCRALESELRKNGIKTDFDL